MLLYMYGYAAVAKSCYFADQIDRIESKCFFFSIFQVRNSVKFLSKFENRSFFFFYIIYMINMTILFDRVVDTEDMTEDRNIRRR